MNDFLRAVGLLVILPVRVPADDSTPPGRAMAFYPLVGLVIGGLLAGLAWLLGRASLAQTAPLLPAALILAAWAGLTGALHLDGWADCCDALFVPVSRERRLVIMKDPRIGSFGATGLILLLLVKLSAIQGIGAGAQGLMALGLAPALARWAMVAAAFISPLARPDGMAAAFRQGLGRREVILATVTAALVVLAAAWCIGWPAALLWVVTGVVLLVVSRLATARLGGLTGDVYGAIIELAETGALVVGCFL